MTSIYKTISVDSIHRFIDALAPAIAQLLSMVDRLAEQPDAFTASAAARIQDTAELLLAIQSDFKMLVSLDTSSQLLHTEVVNLGALCNQVAGMLHEQAHAQGLTLVVHVPTDTTVKADADMCVQILRRLAANALRYNRAGGKVCITAKSNQRGGVVLRVTDSGIGLDVAQRNALFKPFERLGKELCPADGTGMGLAIAHRMAQCMGTSLTVRSRLGRGSIFKLTWPGK